MITAIVQARMGSNRFPGKMLQQIKGKPLVLYSLEQASKAISVDKVMLASTNKEKDAPLIQTVKAAGYNTFAGDEQDVLDRYYRAAKQAKTDIIIRLTGDCPLLDPGIIDKVVSEFKKGDYDYASNVLKPTYPDGLDVEVFTFSALQKSWKEAKKTSDREHVTTYIRYTNKEAFKTHNVENNEDLSSLRWTVDEKEDLELIREVLAKLGSKEISMENILIILKQNPDLQGINSKYYRNKGYDKSVENDNDQA